MTDRPSIKSYYLNLDRDEERGKSTHRLLTKLGLNFERLSAFTFNDIPDLESVFPKHMIEQAKHNKDRQAELAVFYTHRQTWKRALDEGHDYVIIFEDDITTYISKRRLKHLLLQVHQKLEFDVLYLGKCLDSCSKLEHEFGQIYRSRSPYCAHAYMLTRSAMEYLLKQPPVHTAVDNHLRTLTAREHIKAHVFHPSIFNQDVVRFTSNLRGKLNSLANISECQDIQDQQMADNQRNTVIAIVIIVILVLVILWLLWRRS